MGTSLIVFVRHTDPSHRYFHYLNICRRIENLVSNVIGTIFYIHKIYFYSFVYRYCEFCLATKIQDPISTVK